MTSFSSGPHQNSRPQPTAELTRVSDHIFISNFETGQRSNLSAEGITAVLCLERSKFAHPHPDSNVEAVLYDLPTSRCDPSTFDYAVGKLNQLLKNHKNVLVHCTHGQSRSVAVAAAAISEKTGRPPLEVLHEVASLRSAENLVDTTFINLLK